MKARLLILFITFTLSYSSYACSCRFSGPFVKVSKHTDLTVTAKILANKSWKLKVEIERILIGKSDSKIIKIIGSRNGASCYAVLKNFIVGKTYAFALTSKNGKYYLSACGEYSLKIEDGVVKGMITEDFMINTTGWPKWNKKTMAISKFYKLFDNSGYVPTAPCRKIIKFENSNYLSAKLNKVKEDFKFGKTFGYRDFVTAVEDNNLPLVDFYIKNTNILKERNLAGMLLIAVERGYIDVVNLFLNNGVSANLSNGNKFYLVYRAVLYPELLKDLHSSGAKINPKGYMGTTTLMHAVREGCIESIDYLIENGANINDVANNGKKVIDFAKNNKRNRKEVIRFLKKKK